MGRVNDDIITLLNNYYFRSDRINFLGVSVIQSDRRSDCIIIEILFTAQSQDCANMLSAGNNRDLNRGGGLGDTRSMFTLSIKVSILPCYI